MAAYRGNASYRKHLGTAVGNATSSWIGREMELLFFLCSTSPIRDDVNVIKLAAVCALQPLKENEARLFP